MSASAGRVLLLFKGQYDGAMQYNPLDVVEYGVSSYVCIAQTTGNLPTNTTYWQVLAKGISNMSPEAIGIGYGISSDSGSARTATLADYNLTPNGIVAVTFAADVPANATLNINSQGAKAIYYRGSAIVANVIRGGDTVTFAYDGTRYDILCIDGGAGHEIENSAGTKLTQRDVMQVVDGLEAVDDSTNQKTKIKMNLPIVSSADWNAMTTQEQEAYKASHYRFGVEIPDTSGVINAEYMTKLWENTNTTQAFAPQTITLNSADYDFLRVYYNFTRGTAKAESQEVPKGKNIAISCFDSNKNEAYRDITYVSDTSLSIGGGYYNGTSDNDGIIPIAIYGIKKDFQFKVNAIADELSTSASQCFMPDGVTSVASIINTFDYSTEEQYGGKWIDGSDWYYKTIDFGALPNNTSKSVNHNISNFGHAIEIRCIAWRDNGISIELPFSAGNYAYCDVYSSSVEVVTNANLSAYNHSAITIKYVKTS